MKNFIIVSNLTFLAPLLMAWHYHYYFWVFLISGVMVLSILHHLQNHRTKVYYHLDQAFAWGLIVANTYYLFTSHFLNSIYFYLTMACVVAALYCYFNHPRSKWYHSLWHIFSSLITLFSILCSIPR